MKLVIAVHNELEDLTPEQAEKQHGYYEGFAKEVSKMEAKAVDGWGWCTAVVSAQLLSDGKVVDQEQETLGGCSYLSAYDFVASSGYFKQMAEDALENLSKKHSSLMDVNTPDFHAPFEQEIALSLVVLRIYWREPEDGSTQYAISPDVSNRQLGDVKKAIQWVKDKAGDNWGHAIPAAIPEEISDKADPDYIDFLKQSSLSYEDLMETLATDFRYNSGEEIYQEDCPQFAALSIERS